MMRENIKERVGKASIAKNESDTKFDAIPKARGNTGERKPQGPSKESPSPDPRPFGRKTEGGQAFGKATIPLRDPFRLAKEIGAGERQRALPHPTKGVGRKAPWLGPIPHFGSSGNIPHFSKRICVFPSGKLSPPGAPHSFETSWGPLLSPQPESHLPAHENRRFYAKRKKDGRYASGTSPPSVFHSVNAKVFLSQKPQPVQNTMAKNGGGEGCVPMKKRPFWGLDGESR